MDKPIIRIHASSFADEELKAIIDFPTTKEQINDIFRRLDIGDKDESEISFDDIECAVDGIFDVVHPDASFKGINRLALLLERMNDKSRQKLSAAILTPAVIEGTDEAMDIKEVVKIAERLTEEKTIPKKSKQRDMDAR